jgi:hypothetical protein
VNRSFCGDFLDAPKAALLGFKNKTVLLVEIDPSLRIAFVPMLFDGAFEYVVVVLMGGVSRVRRRQFQQRDQFVEERDVIRPFLAAFAALPALDKGFYGFGVFGVPHGGNLAGAGGWAQPCASRS